MPQPTTYFDAIMQCAREKNEPELLKLFEQYACIDEKRNYNETPAGMLAKLGEREASKWLLARGADKNSVARGAATAGDWQYVAELRALGAKELDIVKGAAEGNHQEYVENHSLFATYRFHFAVSAASGGHSIYAEQHRILIISDYPNLKLILTDNIALAAAYSGDIKYAEFLLTQGADIGFVLNGAILGGHREYAQNVQIRQPKDFRIIPGSVSTLVCFGGSYNAIQGGHLAYQEMLRIHMNLDTAFLMHSAMASNHWNYVEYLRSVCSATPTLSLNYPGYSDLRPEYQNTAYYRYLVNLNELIQVRAAQFNYDLYRKAEMLRKTNSYLLNFLKDTNHKILNDVAWVIDDAPYSSNMIASKYSKRPAWSTGLDFNVAVAWHQSISLRIFLLQVAPVLPALTVAIIATHIDSGMRGNYEKLVENPNLFFVKQWGIDLCRRSKLDTLVPGMSKAKSLDELRSWISFPFRHSTLFSYFNKAKKKEVAISQENQLSNAAMELP